jgi:rhamnose utilization protein RhaD (predicted bifunctional aldolase and dehydrogenase)/NAD(P)-dependent dehydrogenase (short-subunit alcohol dehydrogenase family)
LGADDTLVLHGGGNTSVKSTITNIFGELEEIIYVKGSGWDLATIEKAGFAPVRMDTLLKLAQLETLSDTNMVNYERAAMIDPNAPTPSIEAILHAIIPFKYVDHTHTDAVVTVTNTPNGKDKIRQIYGESILILDYVMPGFVLAKAVYEATKVINWSKTKGIVLMNHGLFSFADDAKESYENMIEMVAQAEKYIEQNGKKVMLNEPSPFVPLELAKIRNEVSKIAGKALITTASTNAFATIENTKELVQRGPLTPDHTIRTKRFGAFFESDFASEAKEFSDNYKAYFEAHKESHHTLINPAPNYGVLKDCGLIAFGGTLKEAKIIQDIATHTLSSIINAESIGGWSTLGAKDLFEIEYWELEQAKLKKGGNKPEFAGKIVLVTGAASGIGKVCAEEFATNGACVAALDINPSIETMYKKAEIIGIKCDVTNHEDIRSAIEKTVLTFGGLDIIVSNAGIFPPSTNLDELGLDMWQKSMDINLTSHFLILKEAIVYIKLGIDPAVVMIASKNVPAPGPAAGAYSVAKAGQTQLARVAALELAKYNVRINSIHPHAVFDTGIWTDEVLSKRAAHYGMSIEEYKKNNLLKCEITSKDVAKMAMAMAGGTFSKTTGAQVALDGGSDRII